MNCALNGLAGADILQLPIRPIHAHAGMRARLLIRLAEKFSVMAAASAMATMALAADPAPAPPDAARRNELIILVRHDCGSCHGLTLQGGLGPALLPETLANKDPESLKATILRGRPGTPMPPWQRFVNEAEAEWIVTNLQKGFPN